jgi:hypothetical protein
MTDPVILTDCDECGRVPHSRDQRGEDGAIVTDYICSECGTVRTETVQYDE